MPVALSSWLHGGAINLDFKANWVGMASAKTLERLLDGLGRICSRHWRLMACSFPSGIFHSLFFNSPHGFLFVMV